MGYTKFLYKKKKGSSKEIYFINEDYTNGHFNNSF